MVFLLSVSKGLATISIIILAVSILFPWFTVKTILTTVKIKPISLGETFWYGYSAVFILALLGLVSWFIKGIAGTLGLIFAAYIYSNTEIILPGNMPKMVTSIKVDLGYYIYLIACFLALIAAIMGCSGNVRKINKDSNYV